MPFLPALPVTFSVVLSEPAIALAVVKSEIVTSSAKTGSSLQYCHKIIITIFY